MLRLLTLGFVLAWAGVAHAQLNIVATTANMGMLARTVGGDAVRVTVLAPPDRDAHYLEARPSMMAAMRRADLLVAVGAELEIGWLPAVLGGANNPRVLPGRPGYFEGAAHVDLIEVLPDADRSGGDVHPGGNPHFYTDPVRMAQVAIALGERLALLDAQRADAYRRRASAFSAAVDARMAGWQARLDGMPPVVAYHKDMNYFFDRFGMGVVGYIEPLPGIPPTARHLSALVTQLRGTQGIIVHLPFQPADGPEFVGRELGWRVVRNPSNVAVRGTGEDYLALVDTWVNNLVGAH